MVWPYLNPRPKSPTVEFLTASEERGILLSLVKEAPGVVGHRLDTLAMETSRRTDRGLSRSAVIPAKAGIQSIKSAFPKVCRVDSRFRGNDWRVEFESIPNPKMIPAPTRALGLERGQPGV